MATVSRSDKRNRPKSSRPVGQADPILEQALPWSSDAENAVIGSVLLNPSLFDDVLLKVRADDFFNDANQRLFRHMTEMHNDGVRLDATLLVERLKNAGELEAIGGPSYLAQLAESVGATAHAERYADVVADKSTLRGLIEASSDILRSAYEPTFKPGELVGQAEQKIFSLHDKRSSNQISSMHDVLLETFELIDHRMEHGASTGVPTGFTDIDNLTGGFHPSELIILAARPSMGKTAFATNIAENVAIDAQAPVLFVSLEMARAELAQRMLASQGRIEGIKFRSGMMSNEDREKLVAASAKLSQAPMFIDDTPTRTMAEIAACARRIKRRGGLGLIVIDYLQLISPENSNDPRQEQVAKIARRLKGLSRELEVPILCLAQLNRQVEQGGSGKESHRPRMSHLRESGAIEQDADVVMFVHREEYYYHKKEEAEAAGVTGQGEIFIVKQRNGPTGDVKVTWRHKYTRFENAAPEAYSEFDGFDDGGDAPPMDF